MTALLILTLLLQPFAVLLVLALAVDRRGRRHASS